MDYEVEESKKKYTELAKDAIQKAGEKKATSASLEPPITPGPSTHSVAQKKKKNSE